jgi:hypothetical protein
MPLLYRAAYPFCLDDSNRSLVVSTACRADLHHSSLFQLNVSACLGAPNGPDRALLPFGSQMGLSEQTTALAKTVGSGANTLQRQGPLSTAIHKSSGACIAVPWRP